MYLEKSHPISKAIESITGYGKNISLEYREKITLGNTFWDSGRRYVYFFINLANGESKRLQGSNPFDLTKALDFSILEIPNGIGIIEVSEGQYTAVRLYLNPQNAIVELSSGNVDITKNEAIVLYATRGLKSSYGGIPNFRYHEARKDTGITLVDYDLAKENLIKKGLLDKRGAITTNGKNALDAKGKVYSFFDVLKLY